MLTHLIQNLTTATDPNLILPSVVGLVNLILLHKLLTLLYYSIIIELLDVGRKSSAGVPHVLSPAVLQQALGECL